MIKTQHKVMFSTHEVSASVFFWCFWLVLLSNLGIAAPPTTRLTVLLQAKNSRVLKKKKQNTSTDK